MSHTALVDASRRYVAMTISAYNGPPICSAKSCPFPLGICIPI